MLFRSPFTTPFELYAWSFGPRMLLNGQHWQFVGMYVALTLACVVVNVVFRWWWLKLPLDRPAEGE